MEEQKWINRVIRYVANMSVGPSTLRRQVEKGGVANARQFLIDEIDLQQVGSLQAEAAFQGYLDKKTKQLANILRRPDNNAPNWGAARKVINIYLIQSSLNRHLYQYFNLHNIESFMEVPLDSFAFKYIISKSDSLDVGTPFRIINLTSEDSKKIQSAAAKIAKNKSIKRYELDIISWRNPTDINKQ